MFSLGKILFALKSGHFPFYIATEYDPLYKYLVSGEFNNFWANQSQGKPDGFYSPQFKEMIESLLNPNPIFRWSLTDLIGCEYLQGPTFNLEKTRAEFNSRIPF